MSSTRRLTDQQPTLATVAELAGVSRQTVSNALNNPELLREDTLQRVQAAIDELDYTPNRAARQLRTRASGPYVHIHLHADLDPGLSLQQAHEIVVEAERRVLAAFPAADILIHPDPRGRAEPHGGAFAEAGQPPAPG